jgi:mycothiol synthase
MSRDANGLRLTETSALADSERAEVLALVAAATAADAVGPIDDQVRTEIAHGAAADAAHVLGAASTSGTSAPVVAYAHLTVDPGGLAAHVVVHPEHRRQGFGAAVVAHLVSRLGSTHGAGPQTLRVWAHGDTAAARGLAAACGFARMRDLFQMRRDLAEPLPPATYPPDVTVRAFEPGRDDGAWVELNAAAFATHPEQGRLTVDDLRHRMAEAWFDPAGFFMAERDGNLVASHWTKVHPAGDSGPREVGEVYAVGVHPSAQGLGLGKALTLTGLHHLRDRGLDEVMLYVDGDNAAAIGLYRRLGFTVTTVDVMYARSA